jgi:hypothetical protein
VAGFVSGHLVNRVVNRVVAPFFGPLGNIGLARAGAVFGLYSEFKVFPGAVGNYLTEQFGKFGGVFGLFKRIALVGFGNLRIAFTLGNAAHRQVHADLGTLTVKVSPEIVEDVLFNTLGDANHMLGGKSASGSLLLEFGSRRFAGRAELRRGVSRMNIPADCTNPFLHITTLHVKIVYYRRTAEYPLS